MGDKFFQQQQYFESITEYKRILFAGNYDNKEKILFDMANVYYNLKEYNEAEIILHELVNKDFSSQLSKSALILLAQIYWDIYDYNSMRNVLDALDVRLKGSKKQKIQYITAWTYFFQTDFEQGINILENIEGQKYGDLITDITEVYKLPLKSVTKARILSIIVPGAGQLYSGDYKNSFYSFFLVGSISVSMLHDLIERAYFTGALKYFFLYMRYSRGSIYNMESKIVRENVHLMGDYLKEISNRYFNPMDLLASLDK